MKHLLVVATRAGQTKQNAEALVQKMNEVPGVKAFLYFIYDVSGSVPAFQVYDLGGGAEQKLVFSPLPGGIYTKGQEFEVESHEIPASAAEQVELQDLSDFLQSAFPGMSKLSSLPIPDSVSLVATYTYRYKGMDLENQRIEFPQKDFVGVDRRTAYINCVNRIVDFILYQPIKIK